MVDSRPVIKADINKQIQLGKLVFQTHNDLSLKAFCFNAFTWLSEST